MILSEASGLVKCDEQISAKQEGKMEVITNANNNN